MKKKQSEQYIGVGGLIAAAMISNAVRLFAQDIVDKKVEVRVTFERKKAKK